MNVEKVIFIGSKKIGLAILKTMVKIAPDLLDACITLEDVEDTRSCLHKFEEFCKEKKLKFYVLTGRCDIANIILDRKPDICFVVGWYRLIPEHVIKSVPGGFLGIHNSLLPAYRGQAPLVWAMINGEKRVGFSLFSFSNKMDEGDIWKQESVDIDETSYIGNVLEQLENKAEKMFRDYYTDILNGKISPKPQSGIISYGAKRIPEYGKIDWNKSAKDIILEIHAQSDPYPGAFAILQGEKIIIWKARKFEYCIYGIPGQVAIIKDEEVVITCGKNSAIVIEEIQNKEYRGCPSKMLNSLNLVFE